jgi:hypothetical protein
MSCQCDAFDAVPIDEFLPYVLPSIYGLPVEIAAHQLRMAAISFARSTQALTRTVFIDGQCGLCVVNLEVPDCYSILSVESVSVGGCKLTVHRGGPEKIPSRGFFYEHPGWLYLGSALPECPRALEATVVVVPGQDSCQLDRALYDTYSDAIADGALERLYLMKSAPWFDVQLANIHGRKFKAAVSDAGALVAKGRVSAPLMIKVPRFV